jgi:N-acetylmuramoyl-L-alanine amidase
MPQVVRPPINYQHTSPNYYDANPTSRPVKAVVIHATVGEFGGSLSWLTSAGSGASSSYLQDRPGNLYCLVDPYKNRRSWANGVLESPDTSRDVIAWCMKNGVNPNLVTVSIEHTATKAEMEAGAGIFQRQPQLISTLTPTAEQNSLLLTAQLCLDLKLGVPTAQNVLPHRAFMRYSKAICPGVINMPRYIEKAAEYYYTLQNKPLPEDEVKENGFVIRGEILKFCRRIDATRIRRIQAFGLPVSNEFVNPKTGKTTQVFERTVLEYIPELQGTGWQVQGLHLGKQYAPVASTSASIAPKGGNTFNMPPSIKTYWQKLGDMALHVLGFPISDAYFDPEAGGKITQIFERQILRIHPEITDDWNVQGEHLGRRWYNENMKNPLT